MTIQANFPAIKPSLMLDFANVRQLDPRITFTRASTATYYGTETAMAEQNLLTYSQEFDNAAWTKNATTITANSIAAPDGTTTADTLSAAGTNLNAFLRLYSTGLTTGSVTTSIYAKAGTKTVLQFGANAALTGTADARANFDLANGVLGSVDSATLTASIVSVGSGWYRCVISWTRSGTSSANGVWSMQDSTTAAREANSTAGDLYLWGAQLEQRSAVTAYTATTTQAITNYIPVLESHASGIARFDNNPTTFESLGLLIEESRTNLQTNSGSATGWTVNLNTTPNLANAQGIAPDGTNTAVGIPYGATGVVQSNLTVTSDTNTYTFSFYAKSLTGAGTVSTGTLGFPPPNDYFAGTIFNFSTLALGSGWSATAVGNGWYRLSRSFINTSQTTFINAVSTTTGVVLLWGPQLELGAFATSYIPTVASQVTRAADAASMTGTNFSSWFNAGEGTIYGEYNTGTNSGSGDGPGNGRGVLNINDGTTTNRLRFAASINSFQVITNNTTVANIVIGTIAANTTYKMSSCYKVNDFQASRDNVLGTADTSGQVPLGLNAMNIGTSSVTSGILGGTIKKIAYYPLRVTNAQLQALTS